MDPPGVLHVVAMGLVLKIWGKVANLIRVLDHKVFTESRHDGTRLHDFKGILKKWPHIQCFEPVRFFKLNGFTRYMTKESEDNKNMGHATGKFNCK